MTRDFLRLRDVAAMSEDQFVSVFGPVFEHSPWIARETWAGRPFASCDDLLGQLVATLRRAPEEKQLSLIRAHPDLAGHLARQGGLTSDSSREQAGAGLDRLSQDEARKFLDYNERYRARFGFPFIICARLSDKARMLAAFERRLGLSPKEETETALDEIEKIAALRLTQLLPDSYS